MSWTNSVHVLDKKYRICSTRCSIVEYRLCSLYPPFCPSLCLSLAPPLSQSLLSPYQRSWISWCPGALSFWVALYKFWDYDSDYDYYSASFHLLIHSGPGFKSRPGQNFETRFLLHSHPIVGERWGHKMPLYKTWIGLLIQTAPPWLFFRTWKFKPVTPSHFFHVTRVCARICVCLHVCLYL